MDFLTQEFIEKAGLTAEQLEVISPVIKEQFESFNGKANKDAQAILNGAADKVKEKTNIERQQGEKIADYITRAGQEYLQSKENEVLSAKEAYEKKLQEYDGDKATKAELEAARLKLDQAQKRLAEIEPLVEKASKFDELNTKYDSLKKETAFLSVIPKFAPDANQYEVKAKWQEFVNGVQAKYNIENIDGTYFAIDKENNHIKVSLSELVSKDESVMSLTEKQREQRGSGARVVTKKIDGVPFEVKEGATNKEIYEQIRQYIITTEGIAFTSPQYAQRFAELQKKVLAK